MIYSYFFFASDTMSSREELAFFPKSFLKGKSVEWVDVLLYVCIFV